MVPAILLSVATSTLGSERTYRVTPTGLERREIASVQWFPCEEFEGFSATDRTIVFHWRLPYVDLRCSRWEIVDREEAVVAALERHLDRVE